MRLSIITLVRGLHPLSNLGVVLVIEADDVCGLFRVLVPMPLLHFRYIQQRRFCRRSAL